MDEPSTRVASVLNVGGLFIRTSSFCVFLRYDNSKRIFNEDHGGERPRDGAYSSRLRTLS